MVLTIDEFKSWSAVPTHLMSQTALNKKKLIPGSVRGRVYQMSNHKWIDLYDINEAIQKKPVTAKKLAAIGKAREALIETRKCKCCGLVFSKRLDTKKCDSCIKQLWIEQISCEAMHFFRELLENKNEYLILDIETTGLGDDAEIVEIAIVDLEGTVRYHSLVKPFHSVPVEASSIHGITDEMLFDAPRWGEVWSIINLIISMKTLLIYNAAFDTRIMFNECFRHGVKIGNFQTHCIMEAYSRYIGSYNYHYEDFMWVSLQNAAIGEDLDVNVSHRAIDDCRLCAKIIKSITRRKKMGHQNSLTLN